MDLYSTFAVDEARMSTGVWRILEPTTDFPVEESEIGDRCAVLVASMDNPKYRKTIEQKMKPHVMRRGIEIKPEIRERITAEALAEVVILDWRNFEIAGKQVPYSHEKVVEFLTQPKWIRLKERFLGMIGDSDVFKAEQEEAVVKNL